MCNIQRLQKKIKYEGLKLTVLSYKLGISRTTLWSRLNGHSEFTDAEIKDICRLLRLNEKERFEIFNIRPNSSDLYGRGHKGNRIPKNSR